MPMPGATEMIIILIIVLLLFGGSRLAGLGKSTGRALKEFKEETRGLGKKGGDDAAAPPAPYQASSTPSEIQSPPTVYPTTGEHQAGSSTSDPGSRETRRDV